MCGRLFYFCFNTNAEQNTQHIWGPSFLPTVQLPKEDASRGICKGIYSFFYKYLVSTCCMLVHTPGNGFTTGNQKGFLIREANGGIQAYQWGLDAIFHEHHCGGTNVIWQKYQRKDQKIFQRGEKANVAEWCETAGLSFENSRGNFHVSRGHEVSEVRVMEGGTRSLNGEQVLDVNLGLIEPTSGSR